MNKDIDRYMVTDESELIAHEADLKRDQHTWPDGAPLTDASTDAYTIRRATGGRPSLGRGGSSPQIAFRVSAERQAEVEAVAERQGLTVSALAREALNDYLERHGRSA